MAQHTLYQRQTFTRSSVYYTYFRTPKFILITQVILLYFIPFGFQAAANKWFTN